MQCVTGKIAIPLLAKACIRPGAIPAHAVTLLPQRCEKATCVRRQTSAHYRRRSLPRNTVFWYAVLSCGSCGAKSETSCCMWLRKNKNLSSSLPRTEHARHEKNPFSPRLHAAHSFIQPGPGTKTFCQRTIFTRHDTPLSLLPARHDHRTAGASSSSARREKRGPRYGHTLKKWLHKSTACSKPAFLRAISLCSAPPKVPASL